MTTRRSNSKDGIGLQEGRIAVLDVLRAKMQMSESNKNLPSAREGKQSRNDSNGNNSHRQQSNSKRTDDSLDRE